jgi:hypothetical protein
MHLLWGDRKALVGRMLCSTRVDDGRGLRRAVRVAATALLAVFMVDGGCVMVEVGDETVEGLQMFAMTPYLSQCLTH